MLLLSSGFRTRNVFLFCSLLTLGEWKSLQGRDDQLLQVRGGGKSYSKSTVSWGQGTLSYLCADQFPQDQNWVVWTQQGANFEFWASWRVLFPLSPFAKLRVELYFLGKCSLVF